MPVFDSPPALVAKRTPTLTRGAFCWPALFAAVCLVMDAIGPHAPESGRRGVLWMDVAAVCCLAWGALGARRGRGSDWKTPVDGSVIAGLVVAVLHLVSTGGRGEPVMWLRHLVTAGVCFYALSARLRREPHAPEMLWPAFALITLSLSAFTLWHITNGVASLESAASEVDVRWSSSHGLAKALILTTDRDAVDVQLLLPPGVEPHNFEPKPEDIIRTGKADLFIFTSREMEPWADKLYNAVQTLLR